MTPTRPPPAPAPRPVPFRVDALLLREALAAGRLPLAALRLTILQALDAELARRRHSLRARRALRAHASRFLADHADRRTLPCGREVRGWLRASVRSGRLSVAEAGGCMRALRFLYARVLGRPDGAVPIGGGLRIPPGADPRPGRADRRRMEAGPVDG